MRNASKLRVTDAAEELAVLTYQLTRRFPPDERFGLTAQMRRAAVSVGSNIAEGCGRSTDRGLIPFLHIALGSVSELEFQLRLARRFEFGDPSDIHRLSDQLQKTKAMLIRFISFLRRRVGRDAKTV